MTARIIQIRTAPLPPIRAPERRDRDAWVGTVLAIWLVAAVGTGLIWREIISTVWAWI